MNQEDSKLFLGRDNFQKMIAHMLIRLNMVNDVNARLGKYVKSGRHVSLDEKHKGCQKDHIYQGGCMVKILIGVTG